jgi:hypothetical protein
MSGVFRIAIDRARALFPCLLLCAAPLVAQADQPPRKASILNSTTLRLMSNDDMAHEAAAAPFTIVSSNSAGLNFDLGGSDTRKLQLQLEQPLTLSAGTRAAALDNGSDLLGLDATLNAPLSNHLSLSAGVGRQVGKERFQSLGSIQCLNGTLRADSYTASGCHFVNEPLASIEQNRFNLGTELNVGPTSTSLSWFSQNSDYNQSGPRNFSGPAGATVMGNSLLSPGLGNPLLSPGTSDPLQFMNSEASGVNLNFKVGIATDTAGDIRVGLAFNRIFDANYQGLYSNSSDALSWTLAQPFNTASMDFEWSRGSFSSGVEAFYREPVNFLNRNSLDSMATFDVHFTWRTPWNANLSVGASNVMNAGSESKSSAENQPVDPLESIYGRIPYVRYKQDL